jgi:hypothetical protein
MKNKRSFEDQLLSQNGLSRNALSDEDRQVIQKILKRDRARARRVGLAAIVLWGLLAVAFVTLGVLEQAPSTREWFKIGYWVPFMMAGFYIALVCSVSWALRSSWARHRSRDSRLVEIEARLTLIEEAVKGTAEGGPQ